MDLYDGGCAATHSTGLGAEQTFDDWSTGDSLTIEHHRGNDKLSTSFQTYDNEWVWLKISGHRDDLYNGYYRQDVDWNGLPHLVNDKGAHLFYFNEGAGNRVGGYWQLDNRDQDGLSDVFNGGYFQCDADYPEESAADGVWEAEF